MVFCCVVVWCLWTIVSVPVKPPWKTWVNALQWIDNITTGVSFCFIQYWFSMGIWMLASWYGSVFVLWVLCRKESDIHWGFPSQRSNNVEVWCSLCCWPEQAGEQTIKLPECEIPGCSYEANVMGRAKVMWCVVAFLAGTLPLQLLFHCLKDSCTLYLIAAKWLHKWPGNAINPKLTS